MKVAVIGRGSSYTPELISGFLERVETSPLTELWLMDISSKRLVVVGGFAQRMVVAMGGRPARRRRCSAGHAAVGHTDYGSARGADRLNQAATERTTIFRDRNVNYRHRPATPERTECRRQKV